MTPDGNGLNMLNEIKKLDDSTLFNEFWNSSVLLAKHISDRMDFPDEVSQLEIELSYYILAIENERLTRQV